MRYFKLSGGFTFIELMVVISIIGILAAIAIPNFTVYKNRAQYTEVLALAEPVKKAVSAFYDRWGEFPSDNTQAGLPPPKAYIGRVVDGISVAGGVIYVEIRDTGDNQKKLVWLQPATVIANPTGPVIWLCMESQLPPGFKALGTVNTYYPPLDREMRPSGCR